MTNADVLNAIAIAECNCTGCLGEYVITNVIEVSERASLYLIEGEGCKFAAVAYQDTAAVFVMDDWQSPSRPESKEEIEGYHWCTLNWKEAVMLDGLPRYF